MGVFRAVSFQEILLAIVVDSSNGFSNAIDPDKGRLYILLDSAPTQMQAHREFVTSSEAPMSPFFVPSPPFWHE